MARTLNAQEALLILSTPVKTRSAGTKTDFSIRTAKNWFTLDHIWDLGCEVELHDEDDKPRKPNLVVRINGVLVCRRCFLNSLDT